MKENEKYYDEVIAPKLLEVSRLLSAKGMSFVAQVEYDFGETGRIEYLDSGASTKQKTVHWAARSNGNVDALFMAIERSSRIAGHSSIYLTQLGIPYTPPNPEVTP